MHAHLNVPREAGKKSEEEQVWMQKSEALLKAPTQLPAGTDPGPSSGRELSFQFVGGHRQFKTRGR